nr:conserved hypothetical protein [Hymenolepis microstoma]
MDEETSVLPIRRLSNRKSKPTMADLVDQHRFGFVATTSSYRIASPSPSISLNGHSPSGSNNHSLSFHFPARLQFRIKKYPGPNIPATIPKSNAQLLNRQLDSAGIPGSESDGESEFNLTSADPNSLPPAAEEDEDNLPLSDLCRRVNHPSTDNYCASPFLCASSNCSYPVSRTDERLGGRYCSVECLIRACHQAFHDAFPKFAPEQDERLDYRISMKSALPTTFTNPEGLVS